MLKEKLINIDGTVINLDIVQMVVPRDGGVRVYVNMINEDDRNRLTYWEYEGELAQRIIRFFQANSQYL